MALLADVQAVVLDPLQLPLYVAALAFLYFLATSVYDVFLGPLSKFPGPKLWAFTYIPRLYAQAAGVESTVHRKLHQRYGAVVRVGPRELSFANGAQAWRDVYGHKRNGQAQPYKDKVFYFQPAEPVPSILCANEADHSRVRRILAPAFSEKAAKDQEPLLKRWMDLMNITLSTHADGIDKVDFMKLFICTSFDIMGELTFSENLNMLHDSKYSPWLENIFASIKLATQFRSLRQYHASIRYLIDEMMAKSKGIERQMREHMRFTNERVDRRLQREPERPDFWSRILAKQDEEGGMSLDEQYSNASLFMMAGADATATALAGTTYYLLRNPRCLDILTNELREEFTSLSEVTFDRAARLRYLNAVLSEAMRMHPPNPIALLRTVPKGGLTICDQYVPEDVNVAVNHFTTSRLEEHFHRADEFHPERWLGAEEFKHDHLGASEPFSVGPRNCVGKNIAWHELRLLIIGAFLPFNLTLSEESLNWDDQKMWTFWEKKPLMCTLTPVKA